MLILCFLTISLYSHFTFSLILYLLSHSTCIATFSLISSLYFLFLLGFSAFLRDSFLYYFSSLFRYTSLNTSLHFQRMLSFFIFLLFLSTFNLHFLSFSLHFLTHFLFMFPLFYFLSLLVLGIPFLYYFAPILY